jgi:hypothetical protein
MAVAASGTTNDFHLLARHNLSKILDGQMLFTGLFRMYVAIYKETSCILLTSSMESAGATQAE